MPLLGSKPKPKESPKNNGDNISPEQWIKNSGHSLKGIFLEWLSEQKLFDIINGEIKRIKKENQRKKNMSPEDKLAWKRRAAKLSDETIAKFGRDYLGKNSAEETKEYIRDGLNTVANQIKTGNFYKKASLFGDEDMDKFMEDLEAEWDEDEFSSSGESFRKPYREFMSVNDMGKTFDKGVDKLYQMKYGMSQDEYFKKHFPGKPATKHDDHQDDYKIEKRSYDGKYNYTVHIDTPFPGHFNVTVKNKDAERPSSSVKGILGNINKIEILWKKYISTPKFKKEFESEWKAIKHTIDTEGDEWLENLESEMDLSGLVKDPSLLKEDLWIYATDPENVWLYYDDGSDKIKVVFGYYLEWVLQGFDWEVKLKDIGIATSKGESASSYGEFMSASRVDNRPKFTSKKLPNLERVVRNQGPYFFQDSYGPGELQDDYDFNIYLHTDGPYDDVTDVQVELYNKLTKDRSFIKELEKVVAKEGVRAQKKNGVFTLYYIYNATIYPDGTMDITPLYGYKNDDGDEYSDEGEPYTITAYKIKSKGENYFMRYKAMGEFSKGGSDKNVFTIGLGDIKRYEGLLKTYTSTKKSIRGFISKVIKLANKDINEAKEYADKNKVDDLLDKMSDADNNLLDEMSDLVKGKLEPKNLPTNVAKRMKSYLDKQNKVFNSYDMPEDLYNKWKEIYSSNENDPTMKAINNTARFFEPNTVSGSDYTKIFDKFKDFKVSATPTPAAEMMYLTQRESILSNDDIEELSNAIEKYNAMKREYGPKLLKVMHTVMNNKEDLDQGEITIDDFDLEEFSASDASYDLEKAIKNIDAINFDKSDYTTKERLRQEFKHLMDVCDFEVIPRSDSEKWKKFSEDNYSSKFSSHYTDIVEFIDRELSYVEKDFLASKEFKNIYKRVGEAKLNDIINKSPIGENFIKRLGGKR